MFKKRFIQLIFLIFCFVSCITTNDLEYIKSNNKSLERKSSIQNYRLQKGDLLSIQVSTTTEQQHDFFNKENTANSQLMMRNPYLYGYMIKKDGTLDLPSFGIVEAAGFTLRELEAIIKNIAISYFENPVIKINILNFDVSVLGEVNNPGTFKIVDPEVNVLHALSLAGDITQFGNRKKIKIIRKDDDVNRVFYVDLTKVDILNDADFVLQPHDIIYVAPLRKKFFAFQNITNLVSISISAVTLFLLITND